MNFSQALELLKQGHLLKREGWNGHGMHIAAQFPDEHSKMQRPYLYIIGTDNLLVPWLASQGDLFGEDWEQVD